MTKPVTIAPDVALQESRALEAYLRQRGLIQAQAIAELQAALGAQEKEGERLRGLLARNGIDPDPPHEPDLEDAS